MVHDPIRMPQREDQVGELVPLEFGDELLVLLMAELACVVFKYGLCRFARRGVALFLNIYHLSLLNEMKRVTP